MSVRSGHYRYFQRGWWHELGELSEILNGSREQALVLSTGGTSEAKSLEAQDLLQMCEQHLGFLALVA